MWHKISTEEDEKWTKKYHDPDPEKKCFGGKVIIYLKDGSIVEEEKSIADAHPNGNRPFRRSNYIEKFNSLTDGLISQEQRKIFLKSVQNLKNLKSKDLFKLNIQILKKKSKKSFKKINTIF